MAIAYKFDREPDSGKWWRSFTPAELRCSDDVTTELSSGWMKHGSTLEALSYDLHD